MSNFKPMQPGVTELPWDKINNSREENPDQYDNDVTMTSFCSVEHKKC